MTGYLNNLYAESLAEFGNPRQLPQCGGWILQRNIPGFNYYDAMGCYPLFTCRDWSKIHLDLVNLENELVSLGLVTDPFGLYDLTYLNQCFDVVLPFKDHFVIDLRHSSELIVSSHHRYYARKALRNIAVEVCLKPTQFLDEWVSLYATLIERHNLKGIKAFSKTAFAKQLSIPGIIMFRAIHEDITVGSQLWYVQGNVGYNHLAVSSSEGYNLGASYATYMSAIQYFVDKLSCLDLGAGAGINSNEKDGLSKFKSGWSNVTRPTYFCGRILDKEKYSEINQIKGICKTSYFPAYRQGEFD